MLTAEGVAYYTDINTDVQNKYSLSLEMCSLSLIKFDMRMTKGYNDIRKKTIQMDAAAEIKDDRTYIPLRFVGEALGMQVNWVK